VCVLIYSMEQRPFRSFGWSRNCPPFKDPEGSLQYLQERATRPHLDLGGCSSHRHISIFFLCCGLLNGIPFRFSVRNFVCIFEISHSCCILYQSHAVELDLYVYTNVTFYNRAARSKAEHA
jgi:hypothetical protein